MHFKFKIISSVKAMEPYKEQYHKLFDKLDNNEFLFYQLEYLTCLTDLLNTVSNEFFVVIFDNDLELKAIIPLEIIQRNILYLHSKVLRFAGTELGLLTSCYGGIIYDPDLTERELNALGSTIMLALKSKEAPLWNEFSFENVYAKSLPENLQLYFCQQKMNRSSDTYAVKVTEDPDLYFQNNLSKSLRSQLRRAKKKLFNSYEKVEFNLLESITESEYEELAALHSKRQAFKDKSGVGQTDILQRHFIFTHTKSSAVFEMLTNWAVKSNRLCCYTLKVSGKLASFIYCIKHNNKLHAIVMAIDDEFKLFTPAKLLTLFAIENEHKRQQVAEIDFLADGNLFKEQMLPIRIKRYSYKGRNPAGVKNRMLWIYQKLIRLMVGFIR